MDEDAQWARRMWTFYERIDYSIAQQFIYAYREAYAKKHGGFPLEWPDEGEPVIEEREICGIKVKVSNLRKPEFWDSFEDGYVSAVDLHRLLKAVDKEWNEFGSRMQKEI